MSSTPRKKPQRTARRALYAGSVAALLLVCLTWSGLWLLAARLVHSNLGHWIVREASAGRIWACEDTRVSGFPFAIEINCSEPSFTGMAAGQKQIAHAAQLRISAYVWRPGLLHVAMQGPLHIETPRLASSIDLAWTNLRAQIRAAPPSRERLSLSVEGLSARIARSGLAQPAWSAAHLRLGARPSVHTPGAYDVALSATQAAVPPAAVLLASAVPVDATIQATVTDAASLLVDPSLRGVEDWRRSGGVVEIGTARFSQDEARIEASGELALDDAHRLQGQLQTKAIDVGPLLARLGAPPSVVAIDSLADGLFGGASSKRGSGGLSLPVTLTDGRLSVGPFLTKARLRPIY